jgi:hypothetical protein
VRPARLATVLVGLAVLAGCDSSSPDPVHAKPDPLHSYNGRVIRGWLLALDRQDYEQAAYYFAPGVVIDQGRPFRLHTPAQARDFNASLPCRADLVGLKDEGGTVLATFSLREGPGGPCSGPVKVRYTIREGKFTEWRQLPNIRPERAPARSAAALQGACPGAAAPRVPAGSRPVSPERSAESRWDCPRRRGRPL